MRTALIAAAAVVLLPALSQAQRDGDQFGGFSADGSRYRRGADQICEPLAAGARGLATPDCKQAAADEIARQSFDEPKPEPGRKGRYRAEARGTTLTLHRRGASEPVITWTAPGPLEAAGDVFVNRKGTVVAVEYRVRIGGRASSDVVAFTVKPPDDGRTEVAPPTAAKTPTGVPVAAEPTDAKAYQAAMKAGKRDAGKKRWSKAEAHFRKALKAWPGAPEARYRLAAALARKKQPAEAVAELQALGSSIHPDAIVWSVEARFDDAFAALRADPDFRKAVGLDGKAGKSPSAYERLAGFGGQWEQSSTPCDRAEVALTLERVTRTFKLRITTECRGNTDTTRLSGAWVEVDPDGMKLTFPNPGGKDEVLQCKVAACDDRPSDDCIQCSIENDLWFVLREVRR
jgi:tetratricopeptide (TPR) repeat protein